jgi:excisionase family DNA binding protein
MKLDVKDFSELPLSLTVEQVAGVLGIGRVQAYNLVRTEGFPKIKVGRRIVVPRQAFINWMELRATA